MTTSSLDRLIGVLDVPSRLVGKLTAWLILPMVGGLVYEVIARYAFDAPTEWAYDMTFMLYGTFFMLGSAWTLQRQGHIRTDTFYGSWSERKKGVVDVACYLVFFFPALVIFLSLSWDYFLRSYGQNERIVTSPWLPIVWPFKFVMPATAALLLLQGVSEFLKSLRAALRKDEA